MHKRQICWHGFSGILSRNTFQNKCKQKTKSSNNTYKGVHFQENHRPRISSIFYNHLFYGAHMNRCFWFSKMSLKIFQYNPMTTVNSIFLSETSLQQFGEFWTLSPFLAPWCHKTYIRPGSCDVTILFIPLSVTKKQSNNIGLRTIYFFFFFFFFFYDNDIHKTLILNR